MRINLFLAPLLKKVPNLSMMSPVMEIQPKKFMSAVGPPAWPQVNKKRFTAN